jgi:hypothetical protein
MFIALLNATTIDMEARSKWQCKREWRKRKVKTVRSDFIYDTMVLHFLCKALNWSHVITKIVRSKGQDSTLQDSKLDAPTTVSYNSIPNCNISLSSLTAPNFHTKTENVTRIWHGLETIDNQPPLQCSFWAIIIET